MTTKYTHTITIAVPEAGMDAANHLALLLGEQAGDIITFTEAKYQDAGGNRYAVASTRCKDTLVSALGSEQLPDVPDYAVGIIDIDKATAALGTIGAPGGAMIIVDIPPLQAIMGMGLALIESTE